MGYTETLEKIHSLNKFGSRPGLDRMRMLLDMMGNPQDEGEYIHVAGTNGKGSVCALISSVLRCSGYKTGLFISPYITDFCERIQINNKPISHQALEEIAEYVFSFVEKLNSQDIIITEFEFVTAVAFEYFKREKCQVVVLEVGMGGRLDSTNVIKPPLCAVLTPIGLDHTDILGDTVEKIAGEKCGIIKEGTRVVSSPQNFEAERVIEETCERKNVFLQFARGLGIKVKNVSLKGTLFEYRGQEILLPFSGLHQVENLTTSLTVLMHLERSDLGNINLNAIKEGIESACHPARFEVISECPAVIIDGAHNPDGMSAFAATVKGHFGEKKGVLITGMLSDKDSKASLKYISNLFEWVYTVPINNPRAMTALKMAELCKQYFENVTPCENVQEAFSKAFQKAKEKSVHLCVCGSLYLAGEIRPYALEYTKKN